MVGEHGSQGIRQRTGVAWRDLPAEFGLVDYARCLAALIEALLIVAPAPPIVIADPPARPARRPPRTA